MASQLDNIRAAYRVLEDRVIRALRVQLGDSIRLGEQRSQALQLLQSAGMVSAFHLYKLHGMLKSSGS